MNTTWIHGREFASLYREGRRSPRRLVSAWIHVVLSIWAQLRAGRSRFTAVRICDVSLLCAGMRLQQARVGLRGRASSCMSAPGTTLYGAVSP